MYVRKSVSIHVYDSTVFLNQTTWKSVNNSKPAGAQGVLKETCSIFKRIADIGLMERKNQPKISG